MRATFRSCQLGDSQIYSPSLLYVIPRNWSSKRLIMPRITRRDFLGIAGTGIGGVYFDGLTHFPAGSLPGHSFQSLHARFQDPDHRHSIRPFWFWNGKLDPKEIDR